MPVLKFMSSTVLPRPSWYYEWTTSAGELRIRAPWTYRYKDGAVLRGWKSVEVIGFVQREELSDRVVPLLRQVAV
jgi:hypothetical protein